MPICFVTTVMSLLRSRGTVLDAQRASWHAEMAGIKVRMNGCDLGGTVGFLDDAKKLASEHDQQVDQAIEKVGDLADKETRDKYADKIDKAQDFAQGRTGEGDTAP